MSEVEDRAQIRAHLEAIAEVRDETARRIMSATDATADEVLSVGNVINQIVDKARSQIQDTSGASTRALGHHIDVISQRSTDVLEGLQRQADVVQGAVALSERIQQAGRQVAKMTNTARLLSLNASVESCRAGAAGSAFGIIAAEMRQLSDSIESTTVVISRLARDLLRQLPLIQDEGEAISRSSKKLGDESVALHSDAERLHERTSASGQMAVESILQLAYDALSHLQFQDPISQELRQCDVLLYGILDKTASALGVELQLAEPLTAPLLSMVSDEGMVDSDEDDAAADAGELLLF